MLCRLEENLRDEELHEIADGLLEHHDDGHLDEEVGDAAAGVALQRDKRRGVGYHKQQDLP